MISSPDAFSNYDFFYSSNWWPPVQCTCAHYWAQIQNSTSRFLNEKGELVNHMQKKLHMQDNCLYSNQGDMACFGISLYVGTFWFSCRLQFRRISCSLTHYGQKINWIQKWQFFDRYFFKYSFRGSSYSAEICPKKFARYPKPHYLNLY